MTTQAASDLMDYALMRIRAEAAEARADKLQKILDDLPFHMIAGATALDDLSDALKMNDELRGALETSGKMLKSTEAERDELARQLAQVQRELDNETLRRKSAESGLALLIKEYDKAMTRLSKYEQVTA